MENKVKCNRVEARGRETPLHIRRSFVPCFAIPCIKPVIKFFVKLLKEVKFRFSPVYTKLEMFAGAKKSMS